MASMAERCLASGSKIVRSSFIGFEHFIRFLTLTRRFAPTSPGGDVLAWASPQEKMTESSIPKAFRFSYYFYFPPAGKRP